MNRTFTATLGIALTAFAVQLTMAADNGSQAATKDKLEPARQYIQAQRWDAALKELKQVEDRTSADWNNLMGYTLRKSTTPDLVASERYYEAALRIDPHHRNALEYSGELYLMKGDLTRAQSRLATLATECSSKCEQYTELLQSIKRYQANGNNYLPKGNW